jgi:hypothetical protein
MREMAWRVSSSWRTRTKEVHVVVAVESMAGCLLCGVPQARRARCTKRGQNTSPEKLNFTKGWKVVYKAGTNEMPNHPETHPRRENDLNLSVAE